MLLVGIAYAALNGRAGDVTLAALDASKEAVSLCITMVGVMSFWMGLMEIAREAGAIEKLSHGIQPLIHFLFPHIPKGHPAIASITLNMTANFLGLGWAATPAGLKAMEELAELEEQRAQKRKRIHMPDRIWRSEGAQLFEDVQKTDMTGSVASNEMCTFLVLNISSLQLIPINVIAYRSQYGSVDPTGIVGPGVLATLMSTLVAVVFCKVMCEKR